MITITMMFTFLTILLHIAGWSYAYHYYLEFQINLLSLQLPLESYFMYSLWVFRDYFWIVALLLIVLFFVQRNWHHKRIQQAVNSVALIVGVCLIFIFGVYNLGAMTAINAVAEQQKNNFALYPSIRIWLKDNAASKGYKNMLNRLEGGCYRRLLHNNLTLYVFQTFPGVPVNRFPVEAIPMSEVSAVRMLTRQEPCMED